MKDEYELTALPLPVIHKDFHFNARQVAKTKAESRKLRAIDRKLSKESHQ